MATEGKNGKGRKGEEERETGEGWEAASRHLTTTGLGNFPRRQNAKTECRAFKTWAPTCRRWGRTRSRGHVTLTRLALVCSPERVSQSASRRCTPVWVMCPDHALRRGVGRSYLVRTATRGAIVDRRRCSLRLILSCRGRFARDVYYPAVDTRSVSSHLKMKTVSSVTSITLNRPSTTRASYWSKTSLRHVLSRRRTPALPLRVDPGLGVLAGRRCAKSEVWRRPAEHWRCSTASPTHPQHFSIATHLGLHWLGSKLRYGTRGHHVEPDERGRRVGVSAVR